MAPQTPPAEQIASLQRQVAQLQAENQRLADEQRTLRAILDAAPSVIYLKDAAGVYKFVNQRYSNLFKLAPEQIVGKTDYDFLPAEIADGFRVNDREVSDQRRQVEREEPVQTPQGLRTYFSVKFPLDMGGDINVAGISTDITERKELEQRQKQLQEQVIYMQEMALAELSTPIIPITQDILVMPLVGALDSRRAADMLDRMLHRVSEERAKVMILDITGVPIVDTQVAQIFITAAQAVKLLGVDVVMTGIRPEVAQTLVSLGFNLTIPTYSDLQSAISTLLRR
jgi:rsbT co-antagonist protein RsbR